MNTYDRKEQLQEIHRKRKKETEDKVIEAINTLLKDNIKINFNSVSNKSGITKATLYKNQKLKEMIIEFRDDNKCIDFKQSTPTECNIINGDINTLLYDMKKLEEENNRLKKQIDLLYSYIFEIL